MNVETFFEGNPEYIEKYNALTDEEKERITEAVKTVEMTVSDLFEAVKQVVELYNKIISSYPNKRVVYLALHSKKKRVRRKNTRRILKDFQRWSNADQARE